MSLTKRGNTYWIDVTIKGKRYRESLKTTDKREAEKRAKAFERATWEDRLFEPDQLSLATRLTLSQVFKDHYDLHWSVTKDADGVMGRYATLCRFMDPQTNLQGVDQDRIKKLILDMRKGSYARSLDRDGNPKKGAKLYPYALSTINRVLCLIGYLMNRLEEEGKITKAPRMMKFEETQRTRYLREEEEAKMFEALAKSDDPMMQRCLGLFAFLVDTGCRMGEVTGGKLKWTQIDLANDVFVLVDTKANIDVLKPMTQRAAHVMRLEKAGKHKYPFEGITEHFWRKAWDYAKQEAGLGDDRSLVRHSLRHTTASRLVQRGVDTTVVKDLLGHKSSLTTQRYTHLDVEHRRAAIAVLERDR